MGWLNRALGNPEIDPTGRDRSAFRRAGSQAAVAFFGYKDLSKAAEILERWTTTVVDRFGEYHPNVGRSSLLLAVFQTILKKDELALELSSVAARLLEPLGPNDYDYRASCDLNQRLIGLLDGIVQRDPQNPVIDVGSPIGDFLNDLKP